MKDSKVLGTEKALSGNFKKDDMIVLMMDDFKVLQSFGDLKYYRDMSIRIGVEFDHDRYNDVIDPPDGKRR